MERDEWRWPVWATLLFQGCRADLSQALTVATGNSKCILPEYHIHMGHLRSDDGRRSIPDGMILLSHWNLRDELKSDYPIRRMVWVKQEMIYKVMEHIIIRIFQR